MAHPSKKVAIFGAGIAGLTVAHELARRGWLVSVYEPNAEAGGFFRSARRMVDDNTPSEYSWHGMGPQGDCVISYVSNKTSSRYSSLQAARRRLFLTPTFSV